MEGLLIVYYAVVNALLACSGNVAADIRHTQKTNSTSGCHSYTLDITAQAQDCQHPQLLGVDHACQSTCALVGWSCLCLHHDPHSEFYLWQQC
jgi:hypothetical protein